MNLAHWSSCPHVMCATSASTTAGNLSLPTILNHQPTRRILNRRSKSRLHSRKQERTTASRSPLGGRYRT
jgi:hypothetical protein